MLVEPGQIKYGRHRISSSHNLPCSRANTSPQSLEVQVGKKAQLATRIDSCIAAQVLAQLGPAEQHLCDHVEAIGLAGAGIQHPGQAKFDEVQVVGHMGADLWVERLVRVVRMRIERRAPDADVQISMMADLRVEKQAQAVGMRSVK